MQSVEKQFKSWFYIYFIKIQAPELNMPLIQPPQGFPMGVCWHKEECRTPPKSLYSNTGIWRNQLWSFHLDALQLFKSLYLCSLCIASKLSHFKIHFVTH